MFTQHITTTTTTVVVISDGEYFPGQLHDSTTHHGMWCQDGGYQAQSAAGAQEQDSPWDSIMADLTYGQGPPLALDVSNGWGEWQMQLDADDGGGEADLDMAWGDQDTRWQSMWCGHPGMEYTDAWGTEYLFPYPPMCWPPVLVEPDFSAEMDGIQDCEAAMALDETPPSEAIVLTAAEDESGQDCVPPDVAAATELFSQLASSLDAMDSDAVRLGETSTSTQNEELSSCTMTRRVGVGVGVDAETPHLDSDEPHFLPPLFASPSSLW
ncbi:hypothetical protein E4U43_001342 [Claviceps pusilla]|uniref:Uncharacterized protein n=1 Tax=Claviceps pusilla TaxID=123648 RepID=A0A9P7N943_9HYPO|nr:hypothetical protein E4U43_001342 [Claviceps pusilla]